MKKVLLGMMSAVGTFLAVVLYERLFVEKSFGPAAMAGVGLLGILLLLMLVTYLVQGTHRAALAGKMWLASVSAVVSFAMLDLVAGLMLIRPLSPPLVPDSVRHHRLVPSSYSRIQQRDFTYTQRVNNLGMRGLDVVRERAVGGFRIVMLGDSFTMGKGVEDDETFSALTEKLLGEEMASCGGPVIEVLNGGVDSYAPVLSALQLEHDVAPLRPDLVVLNFDASDLVQEAAYRREAIYGSDGRVVAVPQVLKRLSLNERIRRWVERHLFFTRALLYHVNRAFGYRDFTTRGVVTQANYEIVAHTLVGSDTPHADLWDGVFESVLRMKSSCDAIGARFALVVYPWAHQVSDTEWVPGRYSFMPRDAVPSDLSAQILQDFAEKSGIIFINAYPGFRAYRGDAPLWFQHDMHWTPAGHRVMARALAKQIITVLGGELCPEPPGMGSESRSSGKTPAEEGEDRSRERHAVPRGAENVLHESCAKSPRAGRAASGILDPVCNHGDRTRSVSGSATVAGNGAAA